VRLVRRAPGGRTVGRAVKLNTTQLNTTQLNNTQLNIIRLSRSRLGRGGNRLGVSCPAAGQPLRGPATG